MLHKISYAMALQKNKGFTVKTHHNLIELKAVNTLIFTVKGISYKIKH